MKLIRYSHPLNQLRDWDGFFGDPFRFFEPLFHAASSGSRTGGILRRPAPGVEWYEDDHHYHARVELPGVKREQLRLDAEEGVLRLSLESTKEREAGDETGKGAEVARSEYVLRCPEGVRYEGIAARLADGILELTLPKEEVRKPVSIEVR